MILSGSPKHGEFCPRELRKDIGDAHKYPCTCRLKPFDKDILHMLAGRAKADADAGLTVSHVETQYLAYLVHVARTIFLPEKLYEGDFHLPDIN